MDLFVYLWALGAVVLVSLISLIGIFFVSVSEQVMNKIVMVLVSFASGALLGGTFFHILPETLDESGFEARIVLLFVIIGIMIFFGMERFLRWRHCHKGVCDIHAFVYLNLIGDGIHNFIDGMVIAAAFTVDVPMGIAVTSVVAAHEIPQEIGDFGVLVYGGIKKKRALLFNLVSALTAILGALVVLALAVSSGSIYFLLPIAGGGFIYIACADLMPELHKNEKRLETISHIIALLLGLILMWVMSVYVFQ